MSWNFKNIGANFEQQLSPSHVQSGSGEVEDRADSQNDNETFKNEQQLSPSHVQSGSAEQIIEKNAEKEHDKPYKLLRAEASSIEKFSLTNVVAEFEMNAMIERPLDALEQAIDEQIQIAIAKAEELYTGRKVEEFSLLLFGRGLDNPVSLPLRPTPQNSAAVLIAELERLSQSEGEDNMDKRTLLLSYPVKMIITCVAPPSGAGKFDAHAQWGLNELQRISVNPLIGPECLFYALVLGRLFQDWFRIRDLREKNLPVPAELMDKSKFQRFRNNLNRQKCAVDELIEGAGIIRGSQSYGIEQLEAIQNYWDTKYQRLYRIVAFQYAPELKIRPIWKGEGVRRYNVIIFLQDKHWDVIKKLHTFFTGIGRKYCIDCEISYDRDALHRVGCKARCYYCSSVGFGHPCIPEEGVMIECEDCHRHFFNQRCFNDHKPETCRLWRRCAQCKRVFHFTDTEPHVCNTSYCRKCRVYHEKEQECFLQKIVIKKGHYRICVYDIETRQNEQLDERTHLHVANFISIRITCTRCEDGNYKACCEICGPYQEKEWSEPEGDNCIVDFTEWLLKAFDNKFNTLIWAHNAARFDSHFVYNYLCSTDRCPETNMQGLKIYEFKIRKAKNYSQLIFRDSYLLMGVPLADLPSTFRLDVQPKLYFPHMYNRPENYERELNHLPPIADYCAESMNEKKHQQFITWYEQNAASTSFHLPSALREYCRNDTEILLQALLAFRRIFINEVTNGADPLPMSPTLASLCMNIYKSMFMPKDEIALVPERGYERSDRASVLAIRYLEFRALRENIHIQHAGNGREHPYKGYKLDGWIPEQRKCIEILGCFYHGCLRCYDASDELVDKRTAMDLNEQTRQRIVTLQKPDADGNSIAVEEIWECQIRKELKEAAKASSKGIDDEEEEAVDQPNIDDDLAQNINAFFNDMGTEKGPIDPRQAYFGGRTAPLALYSKSSEQNEISFYDIISLYPSVNFNCSYPIGIPQIIIPEPTQQQVLWTEPEQIQYQGLLKVRVIPPRGLRLPVLPMKQDQRLLFSCCYRCAHRFRSANTRRDYLCRHSDAERAFVTTTTHIELEEALRRGYVVDKFLRAWHYTQWSSNLFSDYVRHFLRLKVQASGFPDDIQTPEQQEQFLWQYKHLLGINIEPAKMQYNPGLRFISKICLNSLWGKFSQRNTLGSNVVIRDPSDFYRLVYDHRTEITHITRITDETIRVHTTPKVDFVKEHSSCNIVISLWTTSKARLTLLSYMQKMETISGAKLLYTDTDSIIVSHPRGARPLASGSLLGEMQLEYAEFEILEYCSGGAKQYGLILRHRQTGEIKYLLRIRGITIDFRNCQHFQYEHFRDMVINFGVHHGVDAAAIFEYLKIAPQADSRVIVRRMLKKYLPVLQKGLVSAELEVFPFGYE